MTAAMDEERPGPPSAAPGEPSGAVPDDSWGTLRAELDARTREAGEARDRHLRTLAEFDNYRKRIGREREDWRRAAQEEVLREILPVLDNLDRALAVGVGPDADRGFRTGVELIHRDFLKALERVGVRPFTAVGETFDPSRHEAVSRVERGALPDQAIPDPTVHDHTVIAETVRGYLFRDRILRPAQVVVAVDPPGPDEARP